jgi:hypothetical protein
MEAKVAVLLTTVKFQPCDLSKETQSLKLGKGCGLDSIKSKCLGHLPRRALAHLTTGFGSVIFWYLGRKQSSKPCLNPAETPNPPKCIYTGC